MTNFDRTEKMDNMEKVTLGIIVTIVIVSLTGCEEPGFSDTDLYGNTNHIPSAAEEWFWE